ncbi:hypothetical protein FXO37_27451 [Capsicum annuum]|nr:hypothetical protein FXO37_27451 [Capsicum annuum]
MWAARCTKTSNMGDIRGGGKLPECLIHKKFSYLNYKEAAKSSLLSKTWLQAWITYPNLEFKFEYGKGNDNRLLVDKVMEIYRERKIPIEKFILSISSTKYHHGFVFPRMEKWLDIALQNGVKQ